MVFYSKIETYIRMLVNRNRQMDYTMRYQILSGRVNFADYVKRRQHIEDGRLIGLNLYLPDNDASIVPIIKEGELNTTTEEYNSYLEEARQGSLEGALQSVPTPATIPNRPTALVATSVFEGVHISFTAGSNGGSPITNYEYYPLDASGGAFTPLSPPQITSPIIIPDILGPETYRYQIRAVNAIGVSADSEIVSVTLPGNPGPPILVYILPGNGEAYVYFTPGTGISLTYEYTLDNGVSYTPLVPIDNLSPVQVATGLANETLATIGLRAKNPGGISGISNELSVTPANTALPSEWLMYDPNAVSSYSGTGSTVANIGSYGALSGTKTAGVTWVDGVGLSRKVFDFNGAATYILYGAFDFGASFTISAWVYPRDQFSINGLLANVGPNVNTQGFKVGWNSWQSTDKRMLFEAGGPGPVWGVPTSAENTIVLNQWQYITYAFNKTDRRMIFYRNGVPVDTADISTVAGVVTSTANFSIGSYLGGSYAMDAQLGVLKVFNSTFDAAQVLADFNATKSLFGL